MKSAKSRKKGAKGKKPRRAKAKSAKPGAKKTPARKQSTGAKAAQARAPRRPGVYPDLDIGREQVSSNECYDPEEK